MKKFLIASLLAMLTNTAVFAGSFSTGVIDTTARANAATAQATANAAEPAASLPSYLASPPAIGSTTPSTGKFTTLNATTSLSLNSTMLFSAAAPTIAAGFGTAPSITYSNGSAYIHVVVGSGGTANNGTLNMASTAPHYWYCSCNYDNSPSIPANQACSSWPINSTQAFISNRLISTAASTPFTAGQQLQLSCKPY